MKIGEWINQRRIELDLSLSELSDRFFNYDYEISKAGIKHWESGRTNPPMDDERFRYILARVLEKDVTQILIETGYIKDMASHNEIIMQIAEIVDHLPKEKQRLALNLVKQLEME